MRDIDALQPFLYTRCMRCFRLLFGLVPALPLLISQASCEAERASRIDLVMHVPLGVLGDAKAVDLSVFDASKAKCDDVTGHVSAIPPEAEGTRNFKLKNTGCPAGAVWCADVELDKTETDQMFAVVAQNESGVLAEGCTKRKIDQDPLEISIKMHIANAQKCCGDDLLQAGEQCLGQPAGADQCGGIVESETCDAQCQSKEIQLANAMDPAQTGYPNTPLGKSELAMAFAPGPGTLPGSLRTAYTNNDPMDTKEGTDVNFRLLNKDLTQIQTPTSLSHQLRLPMKCSALDGMGVTVGLLQNQKSPAIAAISTNRMGIAYLSNELTSTRNEVFLNVHTQDGCAEINPVRVSTAAAVTTSVDARPAIAEGPSGKALIVWVRGGEIFGRIWTPAASPSALGELAPMDGAMPDELELTGNVVKGSVKSVRVAGSASGWVIAFAAERTDDADGGIFVNVVSGSGGLVLMEPKRVNEGTPQIQDQPDIAMIGTGDYLVAWRSGGQVLMQRFDVANNPVGDQFAENPVVDSMGGVANPVVGASKEGGAFFVVAWEDLGTKDVHARLVDSKTGFLPNSVTGQPDVFPASYPGLTGDRKLPAIAVGGLIAIGWQDDSSAHTGVFVRGFPLPKATP